MSSSLSDLVPSLSTALARNWWVLLLRGLVAIAFAVLTWVQPAASMVALVYVFGFYVLADGVLGVWMALANRQGNPQWWVLLLWGLVSVVAGVLTFALPQVAALALLMYIAAWSIVTGVLQIAAAIRLRKEITGEWLLGLAGLVSVLFGVLLVAWPASGALALLWLIAFYAAVFGVLLVVLAFKLKQLA